MALHISPPLPATLLCSHTLHKNVHFQWFQISANNRVVYRGILIHCKIIGSFNNLSFPRWLQSCTLFSNIAKWLAASTINCWFFACSRLMFSNIAKQLVASTIEIFVLCLHFLYFDTWQNNWWLQWLKFSSFSCNRVAFQPMPEMVASTIVFFFFACAIVVFERSPKYLVASMILIFLRCLQAYCVFTHGTKNWGLPVACNLVVFSNIAK